MLLLDARYLAQPISGIPRYTLNLLRSLRAIDYPETLRVLVPHDAAVPDDLAGHGAFDFVAEPTSPRSPADQLRWPGRLRRLGATALHCPDAFGPLRPAVPTAVTLHDVIPLVCRGQLARSRKQQLLPLWRWWLHRQARAAHAVVTVSQHSARDLEAQLRLDPRKISVIPNAVPAPDPGDPEGDPQHLEALGVRRPYVLHVGRFDPYKNVPRLVEAFARLVADPARREQLVLVGPTDPRYPEAKQRVAALQLQDRVVFTGEIADASLQALYRHAALMVMPSLYEGFGLPAIEAMHAGVPVLASDRGALPEVVGNAALTVDPDSVDELHHGMQRAIDDVHLAASLVRAGHHRVTRYDPETFGRRYAALYDRLCRVRHRRRPAR